MRQAYLLLVPLLFSAHCFSQQYPFVHYSPRDGLANNRARFVYQDSKGNLYISTYGGLSVYDGIRFINYNTSNGLASRLVNQVIEMDEDSVWIIPNANKIQGMVNGKLKDIFPSGQYVPVINQLVKTSKGQYYALADEGLFRFEKNQFVRKPLEGAGEDATKGLILGAEFENKLFIIINPGYKLPAGNLLVYDLIQEKVLAYITQINAVYLFKPTGQELWISTFSGVHSLEFPAVGQQVKLTPPADSFHIPRDIAANFIYKDRQQHIWLSSGKGVHRIGRNGQITLFTVENGLTTNLQSSIFQDAENTMWFTNEYPGLTKLPDQQLLFFPEFKKGYAVSDIFVPPSDDSVWLYDGYHQRVLLVSSGGREREFFNKDAGAALGKFVSANGEYLLHGNKIWRWKAAPSGNQFTLSLYYQDTGSSMAFTSGLRDRHGHLVAVNDHLVVLAGNKILREPVHYLADQLTIDPHNRVWVATRSNELFCFEISGSGNDTKLTRLHTFTNVLPGSSPRSITADHSGNIWIGTRDQGLYCLYFDGLNIRTTRHFTTADGLSENFVNYLFCDKDNMIWACTPSGLDRIRVVQNQILVDNISRSNNLYFPISKIQQTGEGKFWILTDNGIITYHPVRWPDSGWKPQLLFSGILINNDSTIRPSRNGELKYSQNNLYFQLSAPTFIDEKQTRFSYVLEGSGNETWSPLSDDAAVNLVNVPPGDYTLRARAVFLHGRYPEAESTFSFTILPPWWQTWWFLAAVGLIVSGMLIAGIRFYYRRKLEKQMAALEKKRAVEKERTRIATDMHDDLGAGLSQIKFLSEAIGMKKQKNLPIEEEVSGIRSFSDEMIAKMGEIVWALNEKNDTLSDLLSFTRSYAVAYLEQNSIACHVEEPETIPDCYVSGDFRRNIFLTVKESLHNIVKHARASEVFITIDITDRLSISIRDNGIGIDKRAGRPAGNGLYNMSNRIREINGHFEIVSEKGTEIKVQVPYGLP